MFMFLLLLIIDSYVTFHFLLSTCLSKEFIFKVFITFYLQVSGINLSKKPEFIHHFRFLFSYTNFQLRMLLSRNIRSNRPEVLCKKGVLRNFVKFTGKQLCQSLFFNKVAGLRPATLLKKRLWHRCFPVNFYEISKNFS